MGTIEGVEIWDVLESTVNRVNSSFRDDKRVCGIMDSGKIRFSTIVPSKGTCRPDLLVFMPIFTRLLSKPRLLMRGK
jgi:hypothetical protein